MGAFTPLPFVGSRTSQLQVFHLEICSGGGGGAQTGNIKVRGWRTWKYMYIVHVQCAYMNHQCLVGSGGHAPPGGCVCQIQ